MKTGKGGRPRLKSAE